MVGDNLVVILFCFWVEPPLFKCGDRHGDRRGSVTQSAGTINNPASLICKVDICYEHVEIHKNSNENIKNNLHSIIEISLTASAG
jgi:hypothetical protein